VVVADHPFIADKEGTKERFCSNKKTRFVCVAVTEDVELSHFETPRMTMIEERLVQSDDASQERNLST